MKKPFPLQIGRVVLSKAGRDSGDAFVVLALAAPDRVLVADGRKHRADHPKSKNALHLAAKPQIVQEVAQRLAQGERVCDEMLIRGLREAGYDT